MKNLAIFKNEYLLPSILSLILLSLALSPLYYQYKATPPQNVFLGLHNNIMDFPMFISTIRQGQAGSLTQIQSLTSEPQIGTWVYFIYIIAGWITGPFPIHPVAVYHTLRFILGFFLLLTFYRFIKLIIIEQKERLLVFFLGLFAGGFPRLIFENQQWSISNIPYLSFFTGFDVLRRAVFLPHALLKQILFLLVIIFWVLFWERKQTKYLCLAIVCGFFLGFLSPVHTTFLYAAMWLTTPLIFIFKIATIPVKLYAKLIFCYTLLTLPSFLYLYWVFSIPPWNAVKIWEQDKYYGISLIEYALGIGPLFFLALPALAVIVGKFLLDKGRHFSLGYYFLVIIPLLTVPLLFLNLQKITGLTDLRSLEIPLPIFWSALGGLTLIWLIKFLKRILNLKSPKGKDIIMVILALLIFLPTTPTLIISWQSQLTEFDPQYYNLYPPKDWYAGFDWLSQNTKPEDVVLSETAFGNLVPAYAGNTVYLGHPVSTLNFATKKQQVVNFYKTVMTVEEARLFLKTQNIKFVVWSFDEGNYGGNWEKYSSILKLRFNTSMISIFEAL